MVKVTTGSWIKTPIWAFIAFSVFITGGCGSNEDAAQIEAVKEAVRQTLKDSNSAEFTNVRVYEGLVCGEVNAKNSFGGDAGKQRFWGGNSGGYTGTGSHNFRRTGNTLRSTQPSDVRSKLGQTPFCCLEGQPQSDT